MLVLIPGDVVNSNFEDGTEVFLRGGEGSDRHERT